MILMVLAARLAHHVRTKIGERLHIVLPFGFGWRVPSVLHGRVGRACGGLLLHPTLPPAESDLPRARQHVTTMTEAAANSHVLMLVHHGGMTARDADLLLLDTRLLLWNLSDWTLGSEGPIFLLGRARLLTSLSLLLARKLLASKSMHQAIVLVGQLVTRCRGAKVVRGVDVMLKATEETTMTSCLRAWTMRSFRRCAWSIRLSLRLEA